MIEQFLKGKSEFDQYLYMFFGAIMGIELFYAILFIASWIML